MTSQTGPTLRWRESPQTTELLVDAQSPKRLNHCLLFIFIKSDVEDFPFSYADACMSALMALVAIVAAEILHLTLAVDGHLIHSEEAETRAGEF